MEHRRSIVFAELLKKTTRTIGILGLAWGLVIAGCGGGGNNSNSTSGPTSAHISSPTTPPTIQEGQTVNITAAVQNDSHGQGVTWSVSGGGTLSNEAALSVTYNAPATVASTITATVTATSVANPASSASITITVNPPSPPPISVSITNPITTIAAGAAAVTLNATVQNDSSNSGVTWTLTAGGNSCSPTCGALSGNASTSVTYTPPASQPALPNQAPTITATAVADLSATATDAFVINPAVTNAITVSITNPISTIAPGGAAVTLDATVQNDSSNSGVTWTLTAGGNNCSPTCGALSANTKTSVTYTPPSSEPSSPDNSPTITATSVADATKSATDAFSIASSSSGGAALLKGQYAFLVSGYGTALAASVRANGSGAITGGEEDIVTPSGDPFASAADVSITSGTYTVGSDNRGTLTYTDANGNSFTFAIALGTVSGGVATKGQMIEFDTNPLEMTGSLALQSSAAFSTSALTGSYALGVSGWDGSVYPKVVVASFSVNAGAISNAVSDINDNGTLSLDGTFTGTIGSIDSSGRGTVTLNVGGGETVSFAVYIVSATQLYAITQGVGVDYDILSGQILQQTGGPYSASSLSGATVLADQSTNGVPSPHAMLGLLTFDSTNSSATYSFDTDDGGGADQPQSGTASYSVSSAANGRMVLTPNGGGSSLILYMIAPNQAFIGGTNQYPDFGTIEPQSTGTFSDSSLKASFAFGTLPVLSEPSPQGTDSSVPPLTYQSGVLTFNGTGTISGTSDSNASGTLHSGAVTDTYTVDSNGRVTTGSAKQILYIVSPTKFYVLTLPSGAYENPTIEVGEQ